MARCGRLLARLDLAAGDPTTARSRATAAVATFRNGDYLTELAATLPVLADSARAAGDLDASTGHVAAALSITGSRGLLPFQAEALTVRAPDLRRPGHRGRPRAPRMGPGRCRGRPPDRDPPQAGLAGTGRLDARAHLDQAEGVDHGWARQTAALQVRLVPANLDPDPLAMVERLAADDQAGGHGDR